LSIKEKTEILYPEFRKIFLESHFTQSYLSVLSMIIKFIPQEDSLKLLDKIENNFRIQNNKDHAILIYFLVEILGNSKDFGEFGSRYFESIYHAEYCPFP
jgi:hypothetical protein